MTLTHNQIQSLMSKYAVTEQQVQDALADAHEFQALLGNQVCVEQLVERLLISNTQVMKFPCRK